MRHGTEGMAEGALAGMRRVRVHPPLVRITHWLNVLAVAIMVGSGWRIYDNVPIFAWLTFPIAVTLGGDPELSYKTSGDVGFGNALLWHFAGMWLLAVNGCVYLAYGLLSGRLRAKLWPIRASEVLHDIGAALRLQLAHADLSRYNGVQRLLYLGVIGALCGIVLSGLAIWKPVQLQWLTAAFGGFQGARLVHFLCMSAIVSFVAVHVALALLVPRTLLAMLTGVVDVPVALAGGVDVPVAAADGVKVSVAAADGSAPPAAAVQCSAARVEP